MEYSQMSLKGLAYDVLNEYNAGRTTSNLNVSIDQVKFIILNKLATYLRQQAAKGYNISDSYFVSLNCVDVIPVNSTECCSVDIGCSFLRTKDPVPQVMDFQNTDGLRRVSNINQESKPFQRMTPDRVPFEKHAPKFSKKFIKYYTKDKDNYIYFYYDKLHCPEGKYLEKVSIRLLPEDPMEAMKHTGCDGEACITDDTKFPITMQLWDLIRKDILQNELKVIYSTQEDTTNNSKPLEQNSGK